MVSSFIKSVTSTAVAATATVATSESIQINNSRVDDDCVIASNIAEDDLCSSESIPITKNFSKEDLITKWTAKNEKRLDFLIQKVVSDSATELDLSELARLRDVRRRLISPRTAKEIIYDMNFQKIRDELISSLKKYVEFKR